MVIGYNGWFDYDLAVRDEDKPGYMRDDCHIHDGLQPNDRGGELVTRWVLFGYDGVILSVVYKESLVDTSQI